MSETKRIIQVNETKSWITERINKDNELLAKLTKKKGEVLNFKKSGMKKGILQQTPMKFSRPM
jgi:hypothetical protein